MMTTQEAVPERPQYLYLCDNDGYVALGSGPPDGLPIETCPKHNGPPRWREAGICPSRVLTPTTEVVQILARRVGQQRLAASRDTMERIEANRAKDAYLDALAQRLRCPWCRAHAGKACRTIRAGIPLDQPWQRFHKARLARAREVAEAERRAWHTKHPRRGFY